MSIRIYSLYRGASSQVFLAQHKTTKIYVAVKIIPKRILISNKELAREVRILTSLDHQNIVKLHDVFISQEHLQVFIYIFSKCNNENLKHQANIKKKIQFIKSNLFLIMIPNCLFLDYYGSM